MNLAIARARMQVDDAYIAASRGGDPSPLLAAALGDAATLRALTADNVPMQKQSVLVESAIERVQSSLRHGAPLDISAIQATLADVMAEENALVAVRFAARQDAWRVWTTSLTLGVGGVVAFALLGAALLGAQRRALVRKAALLESILESIGDGVMTLDPDHELVIKNATARAMFPGDPPDALSEQKVISQDGRTIAWENGPLARAVRGEPSDATVFRLSGGSAPDVWVSTTARTVRDEDGRFVGAVAVYRDISEHIRQNEQLASLSNTDDLTGLVNRRGFMLLADQYARLAQRALRSRSFLRI